LPVSGHSKWSSIKHKKGAADAKRGREFTKLSRAISVAVREGGPDPGTNLALQNAIEKARHASMPKDNIERSIARASGEGADAATYETVAYEGYGPGGIAVYIEALTDNRNRTASDVRHIFSKNEGNLGESGSVAWLFERRGVVMVPADGADEDELTMAAADAGAEDVEQDGTSFRIVTAPDELASVRRALEDAGYAIEDAQQTMLPKTTVQIEDEGVARKIVRLLDGLEDNDDVQGVYANFDISEQLLEAAV
jgi:YebC/PmpR family DNA-binding regulatory protein